MFLRASFGLFIFSVACDSVLFAWWVGRWLGHLLWPAGTRVPLLQWLGPRAACHVPRSSRTPSCRPCPPLHPQLVFSPAPSLSSALSLWPLWGWGVLGHGGAGPPPQGLRDCFIPPDAKPGTGRGSLEPASAGVCGRVVPQRCGNLSLRASSVVLRAVLGSCVCRPALLCPPSEGGPPLGHGPSVPACPGPPPCPLPHTRRAHPQQERAPAARAGGRRAPKTSGGGHLLRGVGEVGRCTPSPEIPARPSGSDRLVGRGKPPERWPLAGRGAAGSGEVAAALRPCPFLQSPADRAVPCLARRLGVSDREAAAQRRPRRNPARAARSPPEAGASFGFGGGLRR